MRSLCTKSTIAFLVACLATWIGTQPVLAADSAKDSRPSRERAVSKAIDYLRQKGQADDGSFTHQSGPAVTSLVTTALLRSGLSVKDPMVDKALKYMEGFVHEDGGIYHTGSTHQNYETCVAIVVFSEANRDGRYDKLLKNAELFIKGLQWDEVEGQDESSLSYGG